ncbi:MAG: DUF3800 domain-containing protein [Dokdonella sp.]
MLYIVYLDEFGHIGPYVSATDPRHKTHPAFGLAGFVLPAEKVRNFSTFFFQLKNNLLEFELKKSQTHPSRWEKKGSSLYTKKNVENYPGLRTATNRILNRIKVDGGFVIYVGIEKHVSPDESNAKGLYKQVMHELIKRVDEECQQQKCKFMIMFDQQDDMQSSGKNVGIRHEVVRGAAISMYGPDGCKTLIEPPVQAESHLYQTLQCADWLCGLVGRLERYNLEPHEFSAYKIFETYFGARLKQVSRRSSIRKKPVASAAPPAGEVV